MAIFLILDAIGLLAGVMLFARRPFLGDARESKPLARLSVIIPARNEEANLPLLLRGLQGQSRRPDEIICVDDCSTDRTAAIATAFGAELVTIGDKPDGWLGKPWACQQGAKKASGDFFLFLDADLRLGVEALSRLMSEAQRGASVISVQPFHCVENNYENISLFFNLIQVAANGVGMPWRPREVGLFGPLILISRADYEAIGGHEAVRLDVAEDLALGGILRKKGIGFRLFLGDADIRFRMYGQGLSRLVEGWTKNFSTGAAATPPPLFVAVFLWVMAGLSIVIELARGFLAARPAYIAASAALYLAYALHLRLTARRFGDFRRWAIALYPVWLAAFLLIFLKSFASKRLGKKVVWKGRDIEL